MNTDNCPQAALGLIAKVFDDGVATFGDANTCNMPPDENFDIAGEHLRQACIADNPVDHLTKAICRLMLALNVTIKLFDALGYNPDKTPKETTECETN